MGLLILIPNSQGSDLGTDQVGCTIIYKLSLPRDSRCHYMTMAAMYLYDGYEWFEVWVIKWFIMIWEISKEIFSIMQVRFYLEIPLSSTSCIHYNFQDNIFSTHLLRLHLHGKMIIKQSNSPRNNTYNLLKLQTKQETGVQRADFGAEPKLVKVIKTD